MPYKDPEIRKQKAHENYLCRKAEDYEGMLERNRESYRRNREKVLARTNRYYEENKQRHAEWMQVWWQRNKEQLREYRSEMNRRWRQENPEKEATNKARRRARQQAVPDTLTAEQAGQLITAGKAMYPGEALHLDHIVPLSRGGGTTFANMQAIPASVNISKHNKLPEEVYEQQQVWPSLG